MAFVDVFLLKSGVLFGIVLDDSKDVVREMIVFGRWGDGLVAECADIVLDSFQDVVGGGLFGNDTR